MTEKLWDFCEFLFAVLLVYFLINLVPLAAGLGTQHGENEMRIRGECQDPPTRLGQFFFGFELGCWLGEKVK